MYENLVITLNIKLNKKIYSKNFILLYSKKEILITRIPLKKDDYE